MLLREKEVPITNINEDFNWDIFNEVELRRIDFYFKNLNGLKKGSIESELIFEEISDSIQEEFEKYLCSCGLPVNQHIHLNVLENNSFWLNIEFDRPVHFHFTNEFVHNMNTFFNKKYKKYEYGGHEFTVDDCSSELLDEQLEENERQIH